MRCLPFLLLFLPQDRAKVRDWTLIYYMSYDNNLERCGPVITDGLEKGAKGTSLAVTILSDDTDKGGLKRIVIEGGNRTSETLSTDNSASETVLAEYLAWAAKSWPAKHYAVVFLDHGGRLDEMCLDQWPGEGEPKKWLSAKLAGPVLREFRKSCGGEVDLLFLQQCGRGSVENLYNFRGAAAAVMASQTVVGAPNTYYTKSLQWLAGKPKATGAEIARQIMTDDEHYTNYVCVDGKALEELPAKLAAVVEPLLKAPKPAAGLKACFTAEAETNFDLLGWLGSATKESGAAGDPLAAFTKWVNGTLIVSHTKSSGGAAAAKDWCGLSLWVPSSRRVRGMYADWPIYEKSRLPELWKALYPVVK